MRTCVAAFALLIALSVFPARDLFRALNQLDELDMNLVEAVNARIELDLRIGASFTRFQTLRLKNQFADLEKKILSYGLF